MTNKDSLNEIYAIRKAMAKETKQMSDKDYVSYIKKSSAKFRKELSKVTPPKNLRALIAELKKAS